MQNNNTGYLIKTNKFGMNFELFFAIYMVFGQVLAGRYHLILHALSNDGFYSPNEDFFSASEMPLEPKSADIFEQLWNDVCSFFGQNWAAELGFGIVRTIEVRYKY